MKETFHRAAWVVVCLAVLGPSCGPELEASVASGAEPVAEARAALSTSGFTPHFRGWLSANGYDGFDLDRDDLSGGSYGGRATASTPVVNQPVIFIHGNSDKAVGTGVPGQTGWNAPLEYFLSRGYTSAELYATTWGPASALASPQQYHSREHVMKVRKLIEAVLAYTGASKVDVIAHSMGVTLARKAILGGTASDALAGGTYSVGPALTSRVDTFVGIAGANRGLVTCYLSGPTTPTCGSTNGLYPGYWAGFGVAGRSAFLQNLLSASRYEGAYRYTIWSTVDEVIGYGNVVWYDYTSPIPGQTGQKVYSAVPYGHFNSKDLTGAVQYEMVRNHRVP